jgi:hypothetical protein
LSPIESSVSGQAMAETEHRLRGLDEGDSQSRVE